MYHCTSRTPCAESTSAAPSNTVKGAKKVRGGASALGKRSAPDGDVAEPQVDGRGAEDEPVEAAAALAPEPSPVVDETGESGEDESWRLALRVWYDAEGPNASKAITSRAGEMQTAGRLAPALAVPLRSGSCYFLLDDFNHHHQHSGTWNFARMILVHAPLTCSLLLS